METVTYFIENGEKCFAPYRTKRDGMYGYDTPFGFFYSNNGEVEKLNTKEDRKVIPIDRS